MKRTLILCNTATFLLLILVSAYSGLFTKSYYKIINKPDPSIKCVYSLKHFFFHFKDEIQEPEIIMFGNSLVKQGNWNTLLSNDKVINRGIAGDKVSCMCERLHYLEGKKAKIWFIEGGINELPISNPELILDSYKRVVNFVKKEHAIPVLNLVLYVSPKYNERYAYDYKKINSKVSELNKLLVKYATENHVDYIDLNTITANNENVMKGEYTTDGIHLNEKAYSHWAVLINKKLVKYAIH